MESNGTSEKFWCNIKEFLKYEEEGHGKDKSRVPFVRVRLLVDCIPIKATKGDFTEIEKEENVEIEQVYTLDEWEEVKRNNGFIAYKIDLQPVNIIKARS